MIKLNKKWLRSHVERCLMEVWQSTSLVRDQDGDYPFRGDTSMAWVAIDTRVKPWMVDVFAHAAHEVPDTVKALREVNRLSGNARFVKVFYRGGVVVVRHQLAADEVTVEKLRSVLDVVSSIADDIGPLFAAMYDGHTPFVSEEIGRA